MSCREPISLHQAVCQLFQLLIRAFCVIQMQVVPAQSNWTYNNYAGVSVSDDLYNTHLVMYDVLACVVTHRCSRMCGDSSMFSHVWWFIRIENFPLNSDLSGWVMLPRTTPFLPTPSNSDDRDNNKKEEKLYRKLNLVRRCVFLSDPAVSSTLVWLRQLVISGVLCLSRPVTEHCQRTSLFGSGEVWQ